MKMRSIPNILDCYVHQSAEGRSPKHIKSNSVLIFQAWSSEHEFTIVLLPLSKTRSLWLNHLPCRILYGRGSMEHTAAIIMSGSFRTLLPAIRENHRRIALLCFVHKYKAVGHRVVGMTCSREFYSRIMAANNKISPDQPQCCRSEI